MTNDDFMRRGHRGDFCACIQAHLHQLYQNAPWGDDEIGQGGTGEIVGKLWPEQRCPDALVYSREGNVLDLPESLELLESLWAGEVPGVLLRDDGIGEGLTKEGVGFAAE